MTNQERLTLIKSLDDVSPLEMSSKIIELELYDQTSTLEILEEVHESFKDNTSVVDEVLIPSMFTVADGLFTYFGMDKSKSKRVGKNRKHIKSMGAAAEMGLTPSRFRNEVRNFSYDIDDESEQNSGLFDQFMAEKSVRDVSKHHNTRAGTENYTDVNMRKQNQMDAYKNEHFGGNKTAQDEYDPGRSVHYTSNPDGRVKSENVKVREAQTDHIISSEYLYNQLKNNPALTQKEIKDIINRKTNYAVTAQEINRPKDKFTAKELRYLKKKGDKAASKISDEVIDKIEAMEKEAQAAVDKEVCEIALNKLKGFDKETYGKVGQAAALNTAKLGVGDIIMMSLVPLTFEVSDSIQNGIAEGVGEGSLIDGLKKRATRLKDYIWAKIKRLSIKITDVVKSFLKNLVNSFVSMFLGVYKMMAKAIVSGFKSLIEAYKVVFGKDSQSMSPAEKGDALVKVIGSLVVSLFGILIEEWIDKIAIGGNEVSIPLTMVITGILTTVVTYALDKMDLFSVKAEKRYEAVKKVFDTRVKDVQEAMAVFDVVAIERLKMQHQRFTNLSNSIHVALEDNDIEMVNELLYDMSDFLKVGLEYDSSSSFIEYFDSVESIVI